MLVNNAGFGLLGGIEETSDAEARRVYKTNVFGLVLPDMRRQCSDHVINFSSIDGLTASRLRAARRGRRSEGTKQRHKVANKTNKN